MQEQELSANILAMLKDSQWHKYVEMLKLGERLITHPQAPALLAGAQNAGII